MATQITLRPDRQQSRASLLERVVLAHGGLLQRDAVRYTRCPADADAAFSDACFEFLSYFCGAEDDPEHALRWLRIAIKHAAFALIQSQRRESPRDDVEDASRRRPPADLSDAHRHESFELLEDLSALKPDERIALLLFAGGYSYEEIAERRGWTYTKVNRCLAEGRAALRRMQGGEK